MAQNRGGKVGKPPAAVADLFKTPEVLEYFRKRGAEGGKLSGAARMEKLTPAQRSEIARNAVKARWAKKKEDKIDTASAKG